MKKKGVQKNFVNLHAYIKKEKVNGKPYSKIKQDLKEVGWMDHLIELTERELHHPKGDHFTLKQYLVDCMLKGISQVHLEEILEEVGWKRPLIKKLFGEIKRTIKEMLHTESELDKRRQSVFKNIKGPIKVKDVMIKPVVSVKPNSMVMHAANIMAKYRIGSVIVADKGPLGILTETDILRRIVAAGLDPETTVVTEVMSDELIFTTPEAKLIDISSMMKLYNIKKMPIMEKGKIIGIITTTEIVKLNAYT